MRIKGFTIVPDYIVNKYTAIGGLIYGKIARYCEWSELNICTASNKRLAEELNLGESTIRKYKNIFEADKLIVVTGKSGETDTVAIPEEMVIEMYTPLPDSAPPATKQRTTPLPDSYKDSIKDINKDIKVSEAKKPDILDGMLASSRKQDKLQDIPEIYRELMRPFCEFYRYPFRDEIKAWVAQVDVWLSRGYQPADVVNACKHVEEQGWEYYQPASILKAFGKRKSKTRDWEAENERLKELYG